MAPAPSGLRIIASRATARLRSILLYPATGLGIALGPFRIAQTGKLIFR